MIEYHYQSEFAIDENHYTEWISEFLRKRNFQYDRLSFVFCTDEYLLSVNQAHLNHDFYTDIITFDYSKGQILNGEIYISTDRVRENAKDFDDLVENELRRVMAHGVLHMMNYGDKTEDEQEIMRSQENEFISMFHVKQ